MNVEKIKKDLQTRFDAPLADFYKRRIIFWKDPEKEFVDTVDEIELENVKTIKLNGCNNFAVKMLLSETDTESNYLVYDPIIYDDIRDNWLLDIELYSEMFSADLISMIMHELNIPQEPTFRKTIKLYLKFFENKERMSKFKALGDCHDVKQLHINILSVLTGAKTNTIQSVIFALLTSGLDDENKALESVRKFGNEALLWELIDRTTGYSPTETDTLLCLAAKIFITAFSAETDIGKIRGVSDFLSEMHTQQCYSIVGEWFNYSEDDQLFEIVERVEEMLSLPEKFDSLDITELINCEIFPCINESILKHIMTEVQNNIVKPEEIIAVVEKRRTLKWFGKVCHYYEGLIQVANMHRFCREYASGFHIADHKVLWKKYASEYLKPDTYYRHFYMSFSKSMKLSNTTLDDLFKGVADHVEGLYKNGYLQVLFNQWIKLTSEYFENGTALPGIPQQTDFYKKYVAGMQNGRVYVIVSDALRYEVAAELSDSLMRTTKGLAEIHAVQAAFPSITKFGMAALLPHNELTLTDDMKVLCDDMPTDSTAARDKIIKTENGSNLAIACSEFIKLKMAQRRELTNGASVVYIYHNIIDAVGDKFTTEDKVFDACETAIEEIKNLVRIITNELSGSNIIITADHGFLYSYKPLEEYDKTEKTHIIGKTYEIGRRYAIAERGSSCEYMKCIPLNYGDTEFVGFAPHENIRIKKAGGGMNYVHGGISLQELVVPVIVFKNLKSTSKKYVEAKKSEILLVTQSRKITNSIFSLEFYQKDPVGGKIQPVTYEIFIADLNGIPVSDRKIIIADKTDDDAADRVFRLKFTLKSMNFNKTEPYYLMITEKNTSAVCEKIEFAIDIAFVNEFDF